MHVWQILFNPDGQGFIRISQCFPELKVRTENARRELGAQSKSHLCSGRVPTFWKFYKVGMRAVIQGKIKVIPRQWIFRTETHSKRVCLKQVCLIGYSNSYFSRSYSPPFRWFFNSGSLVFAIFLHLKDVWIQFIEEHVWLNFVFLVIMCQICSYFIIKNSVSS